jgi:hypothetical protein
VFELIRDHPAVARATYVELGGAGAAGLAARQEGNDRYAAQIEALAAAVREVDPRMPTADPRLVRLIISGLELQIAYAINQERLAELDALADVALDALAAVFAVP